MLLPCQIMYSAPVRIGIPPGTSHGGIQLFSSAAPSSSAQFGGTLFGSGVASTKPDPGPTNSQEQPIQTPSDSSVIIMKSSGSLTYAVKGLTSVLSDGLAHQVSVTKLSFDAIISYVSVPWIEPNVYMQCLIKNTSDYKIFSGPANLLFDDALISITSLRVCYFIILKKKPSSEHEYFMVLHLHNLYRKSILATNSSAH
jgi:hypothetical protein